MTQKQKVYLKLENGKSFAGYSFGKYGDSSGEVVFTTGMTGYPESITDPSYSGQILAFTFPLIGNYGIPKFKRDDSAKTIQDAYESGKIQVRGLIISDYSFDYSHFDAAGSLHTLLLENGIPGIYGVDTRELTKTLRTAGVMVGKISANPEANISDLVDPNEENMTGLVCVKEPVVYASKKKNPKKILLIDCGVKNNIIRNFIKRRAEVIRVPHNFDPTNSKYDFDGIFVSNGPGDPKLCIETIENLKKSFELNKPIFGICLGSQILGLSSGADTFKLKFGHRSQNQPCIEIGGHCYITSQNHGYAVDTKTISKDWSEWFVNNNDGTNEGVKHNTKPFFAVQFHPESSPGPNDTSWLFDKFMDLL
ncbi:MAG: glutamine-hydrolyzing carbamoyl-phosphate synthase small subunit [Ignavibacteria bacterium]|nr:glutamine-hydrolyzing carbamoyl-phosphate synthase small subunit [Ignavibacteria bacterium]